MRIRSVRLRIMIAMYALVMGCMALFAIGSQPIVMRFSERELSRGLKQGRQTWLTFYDQRAALLRSRAAWLADGTLLPAIETGVWDPRAARAALEHLVTLESSSLIAVFDEADRIVASTVAGDVFENLPPRPRGSRRASFANVGIWHVDQRPFLAASHPLLIDERDVGRVIVGQPIDTVFAREIADFTGLDVALIVDEAIAAKTWRHRGRPFDDEIASTAVGKDEILASEGRRTLASQLPGVDCFIVLSVATSQLDGLASSLFRRMLWVGLLATAIVLVAGRHLADRLSKPIRALTSAARELRNKDFTVKVPVQADDELGDCAVAFNTMARQVEELVYEVRAKAESLEEANAALTAAKERAEEANETKSAFLANMSHELRTPMTAILGFTEELLRGDIAPEQQAQFLRTVRAQADHLLKIINDILDISKIEAGQLDIARSPCRPRAILEEAVELTTLQAQRKCLPIYTDVDPDLPAGIEADPVRLRQILINLIGNAIKFTETGYVKVSMTADRSRPEDPILFISVEDTGTGMASDVAEQVFEPFVQADTSLTREHGGTGLGLAICRRLTEMMGGTIRTISELQRGSIFEVEIPLIECAPPEASTAEKQDLDPKDDRTLLGAKLLVVDDCEVNQLLLRRMLETEGCDITIAVNGQEAFDRALDALRIGEPFDVVLMDMQMPIKDGYQATRELRAASYDLPIVAITSHAMRGDRTICIEAGCDEYLPKPIHRASLLQLIARLTAKRRAAEFEARANAQPTT